MAKTRKRQRGGQIEGVKFSGKLNVGFGPIQAEGQNINQKKTIEKPLVKWLKQDGIYYTIVCVDPDAAAKSWLHWLVINCEKESEGTELVKWAPPTPPSGTHTYYFCLFSHAYKISPDVPAQRGYFNLAEFSKFNGLNPLRVATIRVSK